MNVNVSCECKCRYATCDCENGKYLGSILDDSMIICDKFTNSDDEEIKTIPINFNEKNIL